MGAHARDRGVQPLACRVRRHPNDGQNADRGHAASTRDIRKRMGSSNDYGRPKTCRGWQAVLPIVQGLVVCTFLDHPSIEMVVYLLNHDSVSFLFGLSAY